MPFSSARRGEKHDAQEPVGGGEAEAGAVHAQDAGRAQQRQHVVFVGPARRQRDLAASRRTRPTARRTSRPAWRAAAVVDQLGALAKRRAEASMVRSVAGQRRDDRVLHRPGAAQPAIGELLDRGEHVVETLACGRRRATRRASPARDTPSTATRTTGSRASGSSSPSGGTGPSYARSPYTSSARIGRPWRSAQFDQRRANSARIQRARRVVGIDDDQRARGRRHEASRDARGPAAILATDRSDSRPHARRASRGRLYTADKSASATALRSPASASALSASSMPFRRAGGDQHAVGGIGHSARRELVGHGLARRPGCRATGHSRCGRRAWRARRRLDQVARRAGTRTVSGRRC